MKVLATLAFTMLVAACASSKDESTVMDASAEAAGQKVFLASEDFRPTQVINFVLMRPAATTAAKQIELEAPAGCAVVRSASVVVSPESPDYRPESDGIVRLVFVGQTTQDGLIRARFNIGVSFGGAPGSQPTSLVDQVSLTLSPVSVGSMCTIRAYAVL